MGFSKDFIWGAASSAYQTEGAPSADGKGPSIWDSFSHREGAIFEGDNGDTACDAYHRFEEDIGLLSELGLKAYRFSLSWPRIFPKGGGEINEKGLSYYDRVVDFCLSRGITPHMTLFHWDLPQALEDMGGWQNRDVCEYFAAYCGEVAEHFRGRVENYCTINEMQCIVSLGYARGIHAPGKKLTLKEQFEVWHNLLLAHGKAWRAIKTADPSAKVSLASTGRLCYPEKPDRDLEAARQASFFVSDDDWLFTHQMALDPVMLGHYPEAGKGLLSELIAAVPVEEMETIHTGVDFLALNVYNGSAVSADENGGFSYVPKAPGARRTALKWPVTPEVMEYGPRFLWERYRSPVLITENGVSCNDFIYEDGKVHDFDRIDFLTQYLRALRRGADSGVPLMGYFHWSLTDNFEWHSGYGGRMGLIYIDYPSQKRVPKDSCAWFGRVASENGETL